MYRQIYFSSVPHGMSNTNRVSLFVKHCLEYIASHFSTFTWIFHVKKKLIHNFNKRFSITHTGHLNRHNSTNHYTPFECDLFLASFYYYKMFKMISISSFRMTIRSIIRSWFVLIIVPFLFQLYMYQLFRSLAYIHSLGICHRDIKPQNLLLDPETGILKLCDFGSAKHLVKGEPNVSYICSRYYRAPELIFGAIDYTTKIDVWSAGCVLAELLLGQPIFPGDSGVDQLVEIIKVLGTPTREQIREMNPNYTEFKFPQIKSHPWQQVTFLLLYDNKQLHHSLLHRIIFINYFQCMHWY